MHRFLTFSAVLMVCGLISGCGGYKSRSGGTVTGNSAVITNPVAALQPGATYKFSATSPSNNGYTSGISWSVSPATGAGTLSNVTSSGFSSTVTYVAPTTAPSPNSITITATPTDTRVMSATDTFTISTSAPPSPYSLSGHFAFVLSGFDAAREPVNMAGSFTADGSGNITAGTMDLSRGTAPATTSVSLAGTYTIGSKSKGAISLTTAVPGVSHPLGFAFLLAPDANSAVLTGFDANAFSISGTLRRQDSAAFSLSKIAGDFAFKLESNSTGRVASVGKFTIGENSNVAGLADSSTAGAGALLTAAPVTGRITAPPDANGRGSLILTTSAGASRFAYYVVSGASLLLMETESAKAGSARQVGVAERRSGSFSPATANATSSLRAVGFDATSSASGPITVTGKLLIENLTHATLDWTANSTGRVLPEISLRSELVTFDPATGRGTIKIANGYLNNFADSVAFYLSAPGKGFFLDTTEGRFNRAVAGDFRPIASLTEPTAGPGTATSDSH